MFTKRYFPLLIWTAALLLGGVKANGQGIRITYSEPNADDTRNPKFEIVGRVGGNYLVYRTPRDNQHQIVAYDNNMKTVATSDLGEVMPSKILYTNVFAYRDFFYLVYQYQQRNTVICARITLDGKGNIIAPPATLDTTTINGSANSKVYEVQQSEDKNKFAVVKITKRKRVQFNLKAKIFDRNFQTLHITEVSIPNITEQDMLNELCVDNAGNIFLAKVTTNNQKDAIIQASLLTLPAGSIDIITQPINKPENIIWDDVRLKVNNNERKIVFVSFYSQKRRGNIDGLYAQMIAPFDSSSTPVETIYPFPTDFRMEARGEAGVENAFNNYYLEDILIKKDGGFALAAESIGSANSNNRWNNLNNPAWSPYDFYMFNSMGGFYNPWRLGGFGGWGGLNSWNWGTPMGGGWGFAPGFGGGFGPGGMGWSPANNSTRYFADNIALFSVNKKGEVEWTNVIRKSQYEDNTDLFLGYTTLNTGTDIHFIFNVMEKRNYILSDNSMDATGKLTRNPTFKNLDRGYDFMPRLAKQVASRQIIVPCQYRNSVIFAKIEF